MDKITVTSPLLPPLEELSPYLEDIWSRKWLTNSGYYHQKLEAELCDFLDVPFISLFSNGTLALITALQALELKGEVITTPYSFVATSHAILWNNLKPVFVDIDPTTFNIDPDKIEAAITQETCAILPVHVYGNPCDNESIKKIADKHKLKVIYDAAHAFGVTQDDSSILNMGDLSILSFHATKAYSTIEGGAVICHSQEMKDKLDKLKNFGFESEVDIKFAGMNAKLNEVQAAFGLVSLKHVDAAIAKRKNIADVYYKDLDGLSGLSFFKPADSLKWNYSYFPIIINENKFGSSREQLFERLKENDILARKYFSPLITEFELYKLFTGDYTHSEKVSKNVICLPIHADLSLSDVKKIVEIVKHDNK
ncbi:DegT/DnrJ/EryC1/StrS family aminotransferase [Pseudoalteromonas porphyrae]|uniref:Aminotransferase n=1 Tax=Pseudoalteromonas porphyrae TaxID=187330 RepID=A0A0N1EMJ8_9GAMM|nr:DegT/DnrJ/EryC1/StrS family aminotransferase [Pseudoalteromonas porphyrae]KPH65146.1 aminotransferase [Pseudoalteromonas porphyrae]